jgi:hypothetical protein
VGPRAGLDDVRDKSYSPAVLPVTPMGRWEYNIKIDLEDTVCISGLDSTGS